MKIFFILSLTLFLFSCGEELARVDQSFTGIGNYITADESVVLTANEKTNLKNLCESLQAKTSYLNTYVVNNTFSATYSQSSSVCDGNASTSDASLLIERENGELVFARNDSAQPELQAEPLFELVETDSNGSVESFCSAVMAAEDEDDIKKQILNGSVLMNINVLSTNSSECSGSDVRCVVLEYAFKTQDERFQVSQAIKLTVSTDLSDTYRGMVKNKELVEACASDSSKRTNRSMSLKSIN